MKDKGVSPTMHVKFDVPEDDAGPILGFLQRSGVTNFDFETDVPLPYFKNRPRIASEVARRLGNSGPRTAKKARKSANGRRSATDVVSYLTSRNRGKQITSDMISKSLAGAGFKKGTAWYTTNKLIKEHKLRRVSDGVFEVINGND